MLPQDDGREIDHLGQVGPHGEPAQHPVPIDETGRRRDATGGTVGPDDEVGVEFLSRVHPEPVELVESGVQSQRLGRPPVDRFGPSRNGVDVTRPVATLLAFLFAVGFAAHALDEVHGRPLGTRIPTPALVALTLVGLAGAITLGVVGLSHVGWPLIPFMVLRPLLVVGYNLGLFGGVVYSDAGFAVAWGSFPVLVAYVAQTGSLALSPALARSQRSCCPWPSAD